MATNLSQQHRDRVEMEPCALLRHLKGVLVDAGLFFIRSLAFITVFITFCLVPNTWLALLCM